MSVTVSKKLANAWQGALAGGGDPATSPLYVFGPFLRLLVTAGVASIVFGAAVWLAVLTVAAVSVVYRLVMRWVVDGSGGSGLCEEEFGPWAVKLNASITFIEYVLTFLVSMAALVTFLADRLPMLNETLVGISIRSLVAAVLTLAVGFLVNRGPRVAATIFGPATAAVLLLLWVMIIATIYTRGFHLPAFDLNAFKGDTLQITLGGYARILALMTGIEIFANLVAAYDGSPAERSRKAFGSLVIIMVTTCATMLIVGPAIADLADPLDPAVSVFTQTMDKLLPPYLAMAGSAIGIAVLLSACAAAAQGVQNLALGLRYRHYVPSWFGRRNLHGVSDKPVWGVCLIAILCFAIVGTHEETYLALYAAGVFILLSLTSWAVVKRLVRQAKSFGALAHHSATISAVVAAALSSCATAVIFYERFAEGAWMYLFLVPAIYVCLAFFRERLGPPPTLEDRLGAIMATSHLSHDLASEQRVSQLFNRILVPLNGNPAAEIAMPFALNLAHAFGGSIDVLAACTDNGEARRQASDYQSHLLAQYAWTNVPIGSLLRTGKPAKVIADAATELMSNLIVLSEPDASFLTRKGQPGTVKQLIHETTPPVIILKPSAHWRGMRTQFARLLVPLDGSVLGEQVLPVVEMLAARYGSKVHLLSVPEGGAITEGLKIGLTSYLENLKSRLRQAGIDVESELVDQEVAPSDAIVAAAAAQQSDLILMVSHGSGGVERQSFVKLGSVADRVLETTQCPLLLISALSETASTIQASNAGSNDA